MLQHKTENGSHMDYDTECPKDYQIRAVCLHLFGRESTEEDDALVRYFFTQKWRNEKAEIEQMHADRMKREAPSA